MTKVALVTFHAAVNHGARLQAAALRTTIEKMGYSCRVLDYVPVKELSIPSHGVASTLRRLYAAALYLRFGWRLREGENRFDRFTRNHLALTPSIDSPETLNVVAEDFDAFVCGSDQVWRDPAAGFYYLDFVPFGKKKIAYAPSFGQVRYENTERELIRRRVETFNAVSARETEGAEFLSGLLGRPVPVTLDPSLLIDRETWRSVALTPKCSLPKRFILVFTVQNTLPGLRAAEEVRRRLHLPLVVVDMARRLVWHPFLKNFFDAGPEEFLWLADHADFIVTTSFHGTAFAVNFGKPFLTVCQNSENNVNSRLMTLAQTFNLKKRFLFPGDAVPLFGSDGDLTIAMEKLSSEREKSLDFLRQALRGT